MKRKNDLIENDILYRLEHNGPVSDAELDYLYVKLMENGPIGLESLPIIGNEKEYDEDDQ